MLRRKVISATLVLGAFMALGRALDLVGTLIVARLVAPEAFGIVAAALIVLQLAASFTELNIFDALIQKSGIVRKDYDTAFTFALLRGLTIVILMCATAYPVAHLMGQVAMAPVIMTISLAHLALAFKSPKVAEYSRRVEPAIPAFTELSGRFGGFATTVGLAFLTGSYWSIVAGLIVGNTLSATLSYIVAPYRPRLSMESARWLFSFAGWMNLFAATGAAKTQFDRFYVGTRLGEAVLGIYSVATSIASQLIWSLAAPIMNALFAGLASIKDQPDRLRKGFLMGQQIIVSVMMPVGVGLALISYPLVRLILGPEWMLAAPIIAIIAPATAFQMMSVGAHSLSLALGHPKKLFLRNLYALIVYFPLVVVGTWQAGPYGAAAAKAIALALIVLMNLHLATQLLGIPLTRQFANCGRTFVSCAVMAVVVTLAGQQFDMSGNVRDLIVQLCVMIGSGAAAYILTHLLMWHMTGHPDGPEKIAHDALKRAGASLT